MAKQVYRLDGLRRYAQLLASRYSGALCRVQVNVDRQTDMAVLSLKACFPRGGGSLIRVNNYPVTGKQALSVPNRHS